MDNKAMYKHLHNPIYWVILNSIMLVIFLIGCVPSTTSERESNRTPPPLATLIVMPTDEEGNSNFTDVDETLSTGEVPADLFEAVLNDLLLDSGNERSAVRVISAEAMVWNDGSLGCPQPNVMYTQALINGYRVIFELNGKQYDYHLGDSGEFVLCSSGITDRFENP